MKLLPFALFPSILLAFSAFEISQDDYQYMDNLALSLDAMRDSGKGSNWQNYTEPYSYYFAPIRFNHLKLLEIGIYRGTSVKFWENYFPMADLHFIDCSFDNIAYHSSRSQYYLADQGDAAHLVKVMEQIGGELDIIIDDGGHRMEQQITSFVTLWPHLKSGGIYIIEDLLTSYWSSYGGHGDQENPKAGEGTCIQFLKDLIDDLNYVGARTGVSCRNFDLTAIDAELTVYRKEIYSIHFYDSLALIIKR